MSLGRYASTLKDFGGRPHHSCAGLYEDIALDRPGPPHRQRRQDNNRDRDEENREETQR
jgi:hypothetical protein